MILAVRVPDEVYARYALRNPKNPGAELEKALVKFQELLPEEERLVFQGPALRDLREVMEWPVTSPQEVVERVRKLRRVEFEGVSVDLSDAQRQRLGELAKFYAQPLEAYAQGTFKKAVSDVLGF